MRAFELDGVVRHRLPDLLKLRQRDGSIRLTASAMQGRQQQADQNSDDPDNDKKLDQGERAHGAQTIAKHKHLVQQISGLKSDARRTRELHEQRRATTIQAGGNAKRCRCGSQLRDERGQQPRADEQDDRRRRDQRLMQLRMDRTVQIVVEGSGLIRMLRVVTSMLRVVRVLDHAGSHRQEPHNGNNRDRTSHKSQS